jgi:hypothetical protein
MTHVPVKSKVDAVHPFMKLHVLVGVGLLLPLICALLAGCAKKSALEQSLIGRWENIGLHVTIHTLNNTDSTMVIDLTEDNLRVGFDTKPFVTILHDDGTYILEIRSKTDSLVASSSGEWMVDGDSVIMRQLKPSLQTFNYQVQIVGDTGQFRTVVDYDHDGKTDDEILSLSRKIGDE